MKVKSIAVGPVAALLLFGCGDDGGQAQREANARKYYGETAQSPAAAAAARPPMTLPSQQLLAKELLGKKLSQVPKWLGTPSVSAFEHDYELDGAKVRLIAHARTITSFTVFVPNFEEGRDGPALIKWLGADEGTVNGKAIVAQAIGGGVVVTDPEAHAAAEEKSLAAKLPGLRKEFAGLIQERLREAGIDASARVRGSRNGTIRISWIGCSDAELQSLAAIDWFQIGTAATRLERLECFDTIDTTYSVEWNRRR